MSQHLAVLADERGARGAPGCRGEPREPREPRAMAGIMAGAAGNAGALLSIIAKQGCQEGMERGRQERHHLGNMIIAQATCDRTA